MAIALAGMCSFAFTWTAGGAGAGQNGGDTPLPPGWELCVLEGVSAPATQANVADLDEWQAAEGGSTNNTAAYNPFNTRRTTDASGAPLPAQLPANGFASFATWTAGCAATVATMLQPNMWSITAALRSGNVAPPGAFLAVVDQSAWCAASADGAPCYLNTIVGTAGDLPPLPANSAALDVYGNVKSDLHSYQVAVAAVTADQGVVVTRYQQLAASESLLSAAQKQLDTASSALQRFAIDEFVSSGLYTTAPLTSSGDSAKPFGPLSANGVVVQQYLAVAAANLVSRVRSAEAAVKDSSSRRDDSNKGVTQAESTLASDDAAERRSLTQMVADVATLEAAGACTTVVITAPTPTTSVPTGPANSAATTVPTTTVPSTTEPTTTVPSTTVPTTTVPSTTVPTTTVPSTTVPTTTVPSTTVPTTTVPTTTTTTTTTTPTATPGTPSTATPQSSTPAGVATLQGCLATFAPSGSS